MPSGREPPESPTAGQASGLVIPGVERPDTIQIDSGTGMDSTYGNQTEGVLLR